MIFAAIFHFILLRQIVLANFIFLKVLNIKSSSIKKHFTLARTLSISGLKSRVFKLSFLSLKITVKSGLEFILKFTQSLQRYLLSHQANLAILGRYFCPGQQQL
jgi:hypothetical protein